MIEYIARRISVKISNAAQNDVSVNVMSYALGVYLNFLSVVIMSVVLGWITGHFGETMLAMIGFGVLRVLSGGAHLKSLTLCAVVSATLFGLIPLIDLSRTTTIYIAIISIVLVSIYSPTFRHLPNLEGRKRLNFKIFSTILVIGNLALLSDSLALAYLGQCLTLIPIRGGEGR